MLLGIHVSGAAKIYEAVDRAAELDCNTMQIFSRSPQRWREKVLDPADIKEFRKRREQSEINPVFIHVPYLINLASPNSRLYNASIEAYIEDLKEAEQFKADYIVTHMGSHKETSEDAGIARLTQALNIILKKTRDLKVGILLENTSGSGSWLGYKFIHQQEVLDGIKFRDRIGLCIDTAHAFLAGYNIASKEGLDTMLDEVDELVDIGEVKLIHLNDAHGKLGTHHDRHANIGKGSIGLEGMKRIVNHPKIKDLPFILETPKMREGDDVMNLNTVRKLRKGK